MVQIIEEQPGFGARFAQGISRGLSGESKNNAMQMFGQLMQQKQMQDMKAKDLAAADKFYEENYGIKLKGEKDPEMRRILVSEGLKKGTREAEKENEAAPIEQAFDTLQRMRQIRAGGKLGLISKGVGFFDEDTRRARGEYEQLGKSLIQLSTNIPIRNKLEFETLAEKLYDPSITDAEAEGTLDAMERILKGTSVGKKIQGQQPKSAGVNNASAIESELKRRGLI